MVNESPDHPFGFPYYVNTNERIKKKFQKFLTASKLVRTFIDKRHELLYRVAMQEDCLEELEYLLPLIDQMLDDDLYYEELAYEFITKC